MRAIQEVVRDCDDKGSETTIVVYLTTLAQVLTRHRMIRNDKLEIMRKQVAVTI
jgi:hypothetical protein